MLCKTQTLLRLALLAVPLAAAGCSDIDPLRRDGMWQPEGSPQGNMAAQVVNPLDLVRGRGSDTGDGGRGAAAITKWTKAGPGGGAQLGGEQFSAGSAAPGGGGGSGGSSSGASSGGQ